MDVELLNSDITGLDKFGVSENVYDVSLKESEDVSWETGLISTE